MAFQRKDVLIGLFKSMGLLIKYSLTLSLSNKANSHNIERTRGKLVNHELLGHCFHLVKDNNFELYWAKQNFSVYRHNIS